LLSQVIQKLFPEEFESRKAELQAASLEASYTKKLPIFVSSHVLFPGQAISLHIFEMRYRFMINQCISGSREFIVAAPIQDSSSATILGVGDQARFLTYGCVVKITDCRVLSDGRSLVSSMAQTRVKLVGVHPVENAFGLLSSSFEPIIDSDHDQSLENELWTGAIEALDRKLVALLRFRNTTVEKLVAAGANQHPPRDPAQYSLWIPGLIFGERNIRVWDLKKRILASTSVSERLRLCDELLDAAIDLAQKARRTRSILLVLFIACIILYSVLFQ
jgi:Lon protease-like protein